MGATVAYVAGLVLLIAVPPIVAWLKGRRGLFAMGRSGSNVLWIAAMFRLATPNSWWARHFYDDEKLARAATRYMAASADPPPLDADRA